MKKPSNRKERINMIIQKILHNFPQLQVMRS